ncbi:MAG: putative Ig domain-containing protein [Patescibacteria group bacterium]
MIKNIVPAMAGGVVAAIIVAIIYTFSASAALHHMVQGAASKLKPLVYLQPDQPPAGTVGKPYPGYSFCNPAPTPGQFCGKVLPKNKVQINPSGGSPNYTFTNTPGLPFGLRLNLNGNLTGTPTKAGTYSFKICAKDRVGKKACNTINNLVINPKENKPAKESSPSIKAWPLLVKANTLPALEAMSHAGNEDITYYRPMELKGPVQFTMGDPIQKNPCYTTKASGEAYGLCGGVFWQFSSPLGCDISLHVSPVKFDPTTQETAFALGLTGMPCWEDGKASAWSAKRVEIIKAERAGTGLKATLRIYYEENAGGAAVEKALPDFTLNIGSLTKYTD